MKKFNIKKNKLYLKYINLNNIILNKIHNKISTKILNFKKFYILNILANFTKITNKVSIKQKKK